MVDLRKTKVFLLSRLKETGGFGATPLLPATLEDTYFGTLASYFLSKDHFNKIRPKIESFLSQLNFQELYDPLKLYQAIKIFQLIAIEPPSAITSYIKDKLTLFTVLESLKPTKIFALWYLSKLVNEENLTNALENIVGSYKFQTLEELFYLSEINRTLKEKYLDFVLKSQNGDGGFGFYPGTTSFLENTYFAIKILWNSKINQKIFEKSLEFIKACYNGDGGFSRKPGGISYLHTTAMALESLKLLSKSLSNSLKI